MLKVTKGVCVEAAGARLPGELRLPPDPKGFVLLASSKDLGRIDARQMDLAHSLNEHSLGTLLFDLVQSNDRSAVAGDVPRLTKRLIAATNWSLRQWGVDDLPVGYVGSGLGSAAALSAASVLGGGVSAIASHWGRPDLATEDIGKVQAPTLLLVDADDPIMAAANAKAARQLLCPHRFRQLRVDGPEIGHWKATSPICQWMEWHLGSPDVSYKPSWALE